MAVEFDNRLPIYVQIMDMLKKDIMTGKLKPGDKMPSVRELAASLRINPNTIQRTFHELEREGLVETRRGTGRYVTSEGSVMKMLQQHKAAELLERFVSGMLELGYDQQEIMTIVSGALGPEGGRGKEPHTE